MKNILYIILVSSFSLSSCRKPTINCEEIIEGIITVQMCELNFTTSDYDFVLEQFPPPNQVTPPFIYDEYSYYEPVFNPNNPCEIAYVRQVHAVSSLEHEIWIFNMETGESQMLTDTYRGSLDWGSNGWLLFTGTGLQLYKIKANGDSLTQLTDSPGTNTAGKWNPSGTLAWVDNWYDSQGVTMFNVEGEEIWGDAELVKKPLDWINDTTTLVLKNSKLYSQSFPSETITELNSTEVFSAFRQFVLDRENMQCYTTICVGDSVCYYVKLDLTGSNSYEIILDWHDTYNYLDYNHSTDGGDFEHNKLLVTLSRSEMDSSVYEMYSRDNILIMNPDGTDERMLLLP